MSCCNDNVLVYYLSRHDAEFFTQVISRPEVIDAYLKITSCADKSNRRNLIDNLDEEQKDEVRGEAK